MEQTSYAQTMAVVQKHGAAQDKLHAILLDLQDASGMNYISPEVAGIVAEALCMTPAKLYEVLTFYSMLHSVPQAKYLIELCGSTPCHFTGAAALRATLEKQLGVKEGVATEDGLFIFHCVQCFGACDVSPAAKINHVVYGPLDSEEKVASLLQKLRDEAREGEVR